MTRGAIPSVVLIAVLSLAAAAAVVVYRLFHAGHAMAAIVVTLAWIGAIAATDRMRHQFR
jgi:hypothetical protein